MQLISECIPSSSLAIVTNFAAWVYNVNMKVVRKEHRPHINSFYGLNSPHESWVSQVYGQRAKSSGWNGGKDAPMIFRVHVIS